MTAQKLYIPKERNTTTFDPTHPPALEVAPPAIVTFEAGDAAYDRLSRGETVDQIGLEAFNRVTGPVKILGAEPGGALRIELLEMTIARAWTVWIPDFLGLGDRTDRLQIREVPVQDGHAFLGEHLKVPLEPMVGCVGVAPATGLSSTFAPAYPWGGNLDLREFSPGSALYLPVQTAGALLSLGDFHAAMGQGERTGVSLEAAGEATVRVTIDEDLKVVSPRLRVGSEAVFVGLGDDLDVATRAAVDMAFDYLVDEVGLEPFDAYAYVSARVGVRFGGPAAPLVLAVVPDVEHG